MCVPLLVLVSIASLVSARPTAPLDTSVPAARSVHTAAVQESEFREYARVSKPQRQAWLQANRKTRKERNTFKKGYKRWVGELGSLKAGTAAFGFDSEPIAKLYESLETAPHIVYQNFIRATRSSAPNLERDYGSWLRQKDSRQREIEVLGGANDLVTMALKLEEDWGGREESNTTPYTSSHAALKQAIRLILPRHEAWTELIEDEPDSVSAVLAPVIEQLIAGGMKVTNPQLDMQPDSIELVEACLRSGYPVWAFDFARNARLMGSVNTSRSKIPAGVLFLEAALACGGERRADVSGVDYTGLLELNDSHVSALVARAHLLAVTIDKRLYPQGSGDREEWFRRGQAVATSVVEGNNDDPLALETLGAYLLLNGFSSRALEQFERAVAGGRSAPLAEKFLPVAHALARGSKSLESRVEAAQAAGHDLGLLVNLADEWNCGARFIAALVPADREAWRAALALRLLRLQQPEAALQYWPNATEAAGSPRDLIVRAWVLDAMGEKDKAIEAAARAITIGGRSDPFVCRSVRLLTSGSQAASPLRPSAADPILDRLDGWMTTEARDCAGLLAERAFVLAGNGNWEATKAGITRLEVVDAPAARSLVAELVDVHGAAASAALIGLDRDAGEDPAALLRDTLDPSVDSTVRAMKGHDYLRLELELASKGMCGARTIQLINANVFPIDAHTKGGFTDAELKGDAPPKDLGSHLWDEDGNSIAPFTLTHADGGSTDPAVDWKGRAIFGVVLGPMPRGWDELH